VAGEAVSRSEDISQSSLRLAAIALALLAPALLSAAVAEPACVAETYTTVCRDGDRELRIIRDTVSPSGHYGVAWEVPKDGSVEEWEQNGEKDGSKLAGMYDGGRTGGDRVRNFLLRLPDGKPIRRLGGDHMGDHLFYNHRELDVTWSPDERFVAILNQSKWTTDVSEVYVVSGVVATKAASLVPICMSATKAEVAKRRRKGEAGYVALVAVSSIGNDGTLLAKCLMNQIKKDKFDMGIQVRIAPTGNGIELVRAKLCTDDENAGICANPTERE
jgi:hypothetical protein